MRHGSWWWTLLAAVLVTACSFVPAPLSVAPARLDGMSRTIPLLRGQVQDGQRRAVAGAAVRIFVPTYQLAGLAAPPPALVLRTDAEGRFSASDLPEGLYTIEAGRPAGDKALRTGVSIVHGQAVDIGALVLQAPGALTGRVQGSADLLGTDVFIPGTDYLAKADAEGRFTLTGVPAGSYDLAAMRPGYVAAVLPAIQVAPGAITTVADLRLDRDAPVLTSLEPLNGGPGTEVTVRGLNLGASKHTVLKLTFDTEAGPLAAGILERLDDRTLRTVVPATARSGPVIVTSDGAVSNSLTFQVIERLMLSPRSVGLYPSEQATFSLTAYDAAGPVASPSVSWRLENPDLGSLTPGCFVPTREGASRVLVESGTRVAQSWIGVTRLQADLRYGTGLAGAAMATGEASQVAFTEPAGLALDQAGNLYVADEGGRCIRRIAPDRSVTVFAGTGQPGLPGDGGPALEASFGISLHLAFDARRQRLWIADTLQRTVRFIALDDRDPRYRAGYIYAGAGTGASGYDGSDLAGTASRLSLPRNLLASDEGIYIADEGNMRVRLLDDQGVLRDMAGSGRSDHGQTSAPAGDFDLGYVAALAQDQLGNLLISSSGRLAYWSRVATDRYGQHCPAGQIQRLTGTTGERGTMPIRDGLVSLSRGLASSWPMVMGEGDRLYFSNAGVIQRLDPDGRLVTVAGDLWQYQFGGGFESPPLGGNGLATGLSTGNGTLLWQEGALWVTGGWGHWIWRLRPR